MLKHHGQSNLEKKRVHSGLIIPEERVHLQHVREEWQQVGILAGTPENSHLSPQARSRDSELEMVLGWETSKPTSSDAFLLANLPKWCCQLGTKLSNPEPGRVWVSVCVCVVGGHCNSIHRKEDMRVMCRIPQQSVRGCQATWPLPNLQLLNKT